jgi:SNF2 family DNA or RNA helicase
MEVIENRALKLRVRNPARILNVIPKSAVVAEEDGLYDVLVHWDIDTAQVLKNLNIRNVPSPIIAKYKWTGAREPFAHQKQTAAFLTLNRRAFCFNEQGTAKTASAIWAADYLMNIGRIKRVLVICPVSVMQATWVSDLFLCVMHRTVSIAHGDRIKRKKILEANTEFVVINFDGVAVVQKELMTGEFDLIIIDEANAVKTATTERWKNINKLIRPDTWVWMMTGTPASQSPLDAFGLVRMMHPSTAPRSFGMFRDSVMSKITNFKWIPKPTAIDTVNKLLQPAIRFTKEQCLDLPDIIYTTREVPLTRQQKKLYDDLRKNLAVLAAGEIISAVNDDTPHKVLVFVPYTHTIELLLEKLAADGYAVDTIHGGVSPTKRAAIIKTFQEQADPKVLVIQPQAASHGITLHAANTIVWWGPIMSYETYAQANARIHRAGQRNKCLVVKLQGSPVEEKRYKALDNCEDTNESLLALYEEIING